MPFIADAIEVPPIPRLVAEDITPQAVASLLANKGGRLAIISAARTWICGSGRELMDAFAATPTPR
jgi:hypothetical protein